MRCIPILFFALTALTACSPDLPIDTAAAAGLGDDSCTSGVRMGFASSGGTPALTRESAVSCWNPSSISISCGAVTRELAFTGFTDSLLPLVHYQAGEEWVDALVMRKDPTSVPLLRGHVAQADQDDALAYDWSLPSCPAPAGPVACASQPGRCPEGTIAADMAQYCDAALSWSFAPGVRAVQACIPVDQIALTPDGYVDAWAMKSIEVSCRGALRTLTFDAWLTKNSGRTNHAVFVDGDWSLEVEVRSQSQAAAVFSFADHDFCK